MWCRYSNKYFENALVKSNALPDCPVVYLPASILHTYTRFNTLHWVVQAQLLKVWLHSFYYINDNKNVVNGFFNDHIISCVCECVFVLSARIGVIFHLWFGGADNCDISFQILNMVNCELIALFAPGGSSMCSDDVNKNNKMWFDFGFRSNLFFLASFAFKHIQKSISNNSIWSTNSRSDFLNNQIYCWIWFFFFHLPSWCLHIRWNLHEKQNVFSFNHPYVHAQQWCERSVNVNGCDMLSKWKNNRETK